MNKKGLGQVKSISLFTFQREILERGRRREERVLKRFHYQQEREIQKTNLGTKIEESFGTNFEKTKEQIGYKF